MNIAKRITLVRQARGFTIEQMSKKINKTTYDRVETGKLELKFSELITICKVLEINIWELTAKELVVKYTET
jgi:transcriptional regulator with XRE-family HTH domain|tara:strand:- start:19 stop:234 length:216 start_codon:yes stop_codon:yes gene_type:complete